ncbi:MAG: NUDIX domain-containing protein [Candidatus Nanohalobium sp.]
MNYSVVPEDADRDFTASAYVIKDGKVLLMKHQKIGLWLQPGGHIEEGEVPPETAERETREETGYKIKFTDLPDTEYEEKAEDLPEQFKVNLHQIEEGHWHCDFAFRAKVEEKIEATHEEEHEGLKWFSKEELESGEFEMPENVKKAALEALNVG